MKKIIVGLVMLAMTAPNPAIANTANDEQAVRKVIADYGDAWNKHDPNANLALFTDDADWVNVGGVGGMDRWSIGAGPLGSTSMCLKMPAVILALLS